MPGQANGFPIGCLESQGREDPSARGEAAVAAEPPLRILDNPAWVLGCPNKERSYQTLISNYFQVFAFTSKGLIWNMYVYLRAGRTVQAVFRADEPPFVSPTQTFDLLICRKRQEMCYIWKGDITEEKDAWILISLVRQVQQWALTEFSGFVVRHMRQWNNYYEERVLALKEKGKKERRHMKKRDRDSGEKPSELKVDLKRLRSLPHL